MFEPRARYNSVDHRLNATGNIVAVVDDDVLGFEELTHEISGLPDEWLGVWSRLEVSPGDISDALWRAWYEWRADKAPHTVESDVMDATNDAMKHIEDTSDESKPYAFLLRFATIVSPLNFEELNDIDFDVVEAHGWKMLFRLWISGYDRKDVLPLIAHCHLWNEIPISRVCELLDGGVRPETLLIIAQNSDIDSELALSLIGR